MHVFNLYTLDCSLCLKLRLKKDNISDFAASVVILEKKKNLKFFVTVLCEGIAE